MKKLIMVVFVVLSLIQNLFGQDTLKQKPKKECLNEFGLDMTPFIKFYLDFNASGSTYYPAKYFLTYRHYFKSGNLRSAIGGNYNISETPSPYNGDSLHTKYYNRQNALEFRIGYEYFQNLNKRWQVYYGADLRAGYSFVRNDSPFWNGGYANGTENVTSGIGLAPVLGIRFKITDRLSLLTESSFLIQYSQTTSYRYFLPVNATFPPKESTPKTTTKTFGTTFVNPIALVLAIAF